MSINQGLARLGASDVNGWQVCSLSFVLLRFSMVLCFTLSVDYSSSLLFPSLFLFFFFSVFFYHFSRLLLCLSIDFLLLDFPMVSLR